MAKGLLDYVNERNNASNSNSLLQYANSTAPTMASNTQKYEDKNKGGFLGGIGYTLGKLGTGAFSILEGVWDFTAGGIADLFGADEWAEEQFANNVTAEWNQDLDEWYNPGNGWRMAGDIVSGVGNTLAGIGTAAALTFFSGGALAPYASAIAAGTMGLGAAGGATSEAYAKTGELGFKEYAYGALAGGTEAALEKFTGVTGKYAAKLLGKETAKTVAKKTVLGNLARDFAGEFFEEGISEFITPYYQRWTQVDPNAENATIQQIGYAGLVGGLSGALMGGIGTGISTVQALNRGNEISKNRDYANSVVQIAEKFANYENENQTGKEAYQYVNSIVGEYKKNDNGTGDLSLKQKKLLAEMERANVVLTYEPAIQQSKEKILANADAFVEYINSRKITDGTTGKPFHFANSAEFIKNDNLVTQFAVADALGELLLTPDNVYNLVSRQKTNGITEDDFRNFQKNANAQSKKAVGEMFGIDVDAVSYEDFINAIKNTDSAKLNDVQGGMQARRASKQAIAKANNTNEQVYAFKKSDIKNEGTRVYKTKDGSMFAVTKVGTDYYLYDGTNISKKLNILQAIGAINQLNGVQATQTTTETQKTAQNQTMAGGTQNVSAESKTAQESKATASQEEKKNAEKKVKAKKGIRREDGSIVSINELKKNAKNKTQKSAVETIAFLSKVFGTQYYVYESYEDSKGERVYKDKDGNEVYAPNGYSRGVDGSIHVDLNAGEFGEGVVLNTLAHEQGHHIKRVNPDGFQMLADFIVKHYKETGVDVDAIVKERVELMRKRGRLNNLTEKQVYDKAFEDVICDGLETVYHDGKVVEMVASLNKTNKGKKVLKQLLEAIKKVVARIKNAYSGVGAKTTAGQKVANMSLEQMQELQSIFVKALDEAETVYSYLKAAEMLPDSGNINFSLRAGEKTISGAGEVKKNLVALHNLSEDNLMRVLSLGGFPMPSIAVSTINLPHENYGDITVIFGRETVDPQVDARNVVYDRDAWTPTTPTVDVKLDNQKVGALVKELQSEVGDNSAYKRDVYNFFDSKFRDNNGDYIVSEYDYTKDAFGERAIKNSGIIAAYLNEKGIKVEPVYTERGFNMGWATFTRKEAQALFDYVGITKDVTSDNATQKQRETILNKYVEYQAKKKLNLMRRFKKNPNLTLEDAIASIRKDYDDGNVSQLFFMAEDFFNENRPKDVYDEYATIDKMQSEITDKEDFKDWFWDKIEGTFEKKGIDNDTEVFDRKGNRRSYEQRHFAYTAENIVKAMSKGAQEGKTGFGMTAGALAAKLSTSFESIEDIHDAKKYLALVSEEDLKLFNDKTYELYDEIVTEIAGKSSDFLVDSGRRDDVGEILGVCAGAKPLTVDNIKRLFDRETKGYDLRYKFNDKIAEQVLTLFESLKHIPTTYFEAKPRRVVELNEIKNILLPNTASNKLIRELDKRSIPHTEYTESNKRNDIIKEMDDVMFSDRSNGLDKKRKAGYTYKARNPQSVTKSEFDHHYWASANNILSRNEFGVLDSAIGSIKAGNNYNQNADGLYMVPVGENGVLNKIVLTDGKYNAYSINAVIKINYDSETELSLERNIIYASERKGIFTKTNGIVEVYHAKDFRFSDFQRKLTQNLQNSNGKQNGTRNSAKVKESRRLKPIDKDYLAAVDNGYTKIAQSMVDNAAKDAGYTIKAYHGSRHVFTAFDKTKLGSNTKTETSKRWFFAADQKTANSYYPYGVMQELAKKYSWAKPEDVKQKGKLYSLYLKMENPLTVDVKDYDYAAHREKADAWMEFVEQAEKNGNDGIILLNAMDNQLDTSARESTVYMFREPNQAKSADVVTYDDNGNVIPLSKRFDIEQPDIRYQEREPIKGADKVMTELPNDSVTLKDVVSGKATAQQLKSQVKGNVVEKTEATKILATNAQAGVERVLKEGKTKNAEAITNYVRAGRAAALNAIDKDGGQYNLDGSKRVGQSLGKILMPVYKANEQDGQTYEDFELYLLHYHNIDRYAVGKPVFNKADAPIEQHVTSEDSRKAVEELEKQYPWFRKIAEKVWKYNDNNLQLAVDGGLYTQEYVDELREMYPHYVPTYREKDATKAGALLGRNNIQINNAKKIAVGSDERILPLDDTMAAQTIQKTTAARMNSLLVQMLENGDTDDFSVIASEDADIDVDTDTEVTFHEDKTKNEYQITFYHNGKQVTAQVSWAVYKGIEAYRGSADTNNNVAVAALAKANTVFKKLVTSWNPFFSFFKNPVRDMQDALLYTKYGVRTFLKNYKRARNEIKNNGKYWQEAKAAGIVAASVYDQEKGIEYKQEQKGVTAAKKRVADKLESASNAIEMAPRMAEYISAREAGLTVQEALLQAQDVTTNFGRGGTFAKTLNRTIMPFLNPSIQGFSKMWRAYTGEDGAKKWVTLIIKSLILGVGASVLNDLLNGDEEEYENLSDYVKEQNYVLALGNGDFLKLPKGRVAGVFGSAYLRGRRYAKGEQDAWKGYFGSVASSVTPVDNITRTIFSPITDVQTNTAWHGGAIESQKWDDTAPKDRYDESTSKISIWLGQVFNYSPTKIDYLLEQYTGVVGDLVLPMTSTQAESGIVSQNLLANSVTNSRWSNEFYTALEDYTYKKTAGDLQAKGVVKYLTAIRGTVSDMNADKQKIQASTTLSDKDKLTETRIMQAAINTLMQESLGNVEYLYKELGKYDLEDEEDFNKAYRDTISVVMGEEYALKTYNKNVYEKATMLNTLGVDYATYYDVYFDLQDIESDKDKNGKTISGSKKAKVLSYLMSQDLSTTQKLILLMSQGYSIADGDLKGISAKQAKTAVAKYLAKLSISKAEKEELAKMLGFTVNNGKIIVN